MRFYPAPAFAVLLIFASAAQLGCQESASSVDAGARADAQAGADGSDARVDADAGVRVDAGADGGSADAAGPSDAATEDAEARGFTELAPLAAGPRQETAVVALNGEIWVIGGYDDVGQYVAIVEAYDPARDTWRRTADLPVRMHHANAAVVDGRIYVLGFLGGGFIHDGRVFAYDPEADAWTPRASMPAGRARGSSAVGVHEGRIYVVGGLRSVVSVADFDEYDPVADAWRALPPIPRVSDHLVAGVIGDRFYAVGGRSGGIGGHTDRVEVFDFSTGRWSEGVPMPTSRGGAAAAVLDDVLYVFGGEGNASAPPANLFDQVESYSPKVGRWSVHEAMSPARHGTGAAAVSGRIYVPGGADVQGFGAVATHQAFVP